ncbi:MAG: helix-turn-helix transcriptional regulator [Anaerolineaceae bacterium]|nr:helix-turn-helix transcriptional regulator [Anaerolineaceae bacterium]
MTNKNETRLKLRTKKIALLLQDARIFTRYSPEKCAIFLGISEEQYLSYESGGQSPSLPELELLAFIFDVPLEHFWGNQVLAPQNQDTKEADFQSLLGLRKRIIQTRLRQWLQTTNLDNAQLSEKTGWDEQTIENIRQGTANLKLPELELLCAALDARVESLFDEKGRVGEWHRRKQSVEKFDQLSPDLQEFVSKPVNHPYIELARRLSDLSVEKLRAVAEGLLEITY